MSSLYRIKIASIKDTKVTAKIDVIHPDAGSSFASKDFALQILLTTGNGSRGYFNRLPIPRDEWEQLVAEHPKRDDYALWQEYDDGMTLTITQEEYNKLSDHDYFEQRKEELKAQYGFGISGWGSSNGTYQLRLESDYRGVLNAAAKVIVAKPVKAKLAKDSYTLDFEVSDVAYLHHLREKMEYDTACFNLLDYYGPPIITLADNEALRLTYSDEKSNKFWKIMQQGADLVITYGKTGTAGRQTSKTYSNASLAKKERDKAINEKLDKGYEKLA